MKVFGSAVLISASMFEGTAAVTLKVVAGYSTLVKIDGHAVCLDTVTGMTDGTPPGVVQYQVRAAGQQLVGSTG